MSTPAKHQHPYSEPRRAHQSRVKAGDAEAFQTWSNLGRQQGVVLIIVILAIALMVTLLAVMIEEQHLLARKVTNQRAAEQSYQLAEGMNAWAARVLRDDDNPALDYQGEDWYLFGRPELRTDDEDDDDSGFSLTPSSEADEEEPPTIDFGVEGVTGTIDDLQGRFNLNNLSNPNRQFLSGQRRIFQNLLELLDLGEFDARNQLVENLIDWVDQNNTSRSIGLESGEYRARDLPYHAADQKLTSLGELRFIDGYTDEIIRAIKPFVSVLPVDNARININTTTTEVLSSISNATIVTTDPVASFLENRQRDDFTGFTAAQIQDAIGAIIAVSPAGQVPVPNMLQVTSQYFEIKTRVELGDLQYCLNSIVLRAGRAVQANAAAQAGGGGGQASPAAQAQTQAASNAPPISVLNREHSNFCEQETESTEPLG